MTPGVWPQPPLPRLTQEDAPDGRWRTIRELEPAIGAEAAQVVKVSLAVKTWLLTSGAPAPAPRSGQHAPGLTRGHERARVAGGAEDWRPPAVIRPPAPLSESLASHRIAVHSRPAGPHLPDLALPCHELSRSAAEAGAHLAAFLFARLAWEVDARGNSDPTYTFEMARRAAAIPELAALGQAWLTWAAVQGRRNARWGVTALSVRSLASYIAAEGDFPTSLRLRRVALWAEARDRGFPPRADTGDAG